MNTSFNPFSLDGKRIVVTGASSGIGKATAIACSKMGAQLIVTGRNAERLAQTVAQMEGEGHVSFTADLATAEGREQLIGAIDGKIDGIVHCAGVTGYKIFQFVKDSDVEDMFEINFNTPLKLTRDLIKGKKVNKGGSIVFITSTSGVMATFMGGSIYSATKGAVSGLIKGLALELAPKNIRVNSVMPSMIATPMSHRSEITPEQYEADKNRYPLKRYGEPEEVAYGIIYLLSNASSFTTGSNLLIDGGIMLV